MGILLAVILFGFIVFFHELGHFLLAKKNGIDVDEFAVGMGPALFQKKYRGTVYSIRILPIGGFCAMGEDEEASDSPNNFNKKSVWARISVIAAGPIFNFILAWVFSVILIFMTGYDEPVVGAVEEGYPAYEAGLRPGDRITEMGGKNIHIFREISAYLQFHPGENVSLTYERDGKETSVTLTPEYDEELGYARVGLGSAGYTRADLLSAFSYGTYEVKYWIQVTIDSLRMLVTGQIGVDQLSGPVGIVDVVDDAYQQSWSACGDGPDAQPGDPSVGKLRGDEPAAAAGAGRRTAGISLRGSSAKEKGSAGKRRICAFCRDRASYDPDGGCNVQ